jgi:hypothetical protein
MMELILDEYITRSYHNMIVEVNGDMFHVFITGVVDGPKWLMSTRNYQDAWRCVKGATTMHLRDHVAY